MTSAEYRNPVALTVTVPWDGSRRIPQPRFEIARHVEFEASARRYTKVWRPSSVQEPSVFRRFLDPLDDEGFHGHLRRLQSQTHLIFKRLEERGAGEDRPALVDVRCNHWRQ